MDLKHTNAVVFTNKDGKEIVIKENDVVKISTTSQTEFVGRIFNINTDVGNFEIDISEKFNQKTVIRSFSGNVEIQIIK